MSAYRRSNPPSRWVATLLVAFLAVVIHSPGAFAQLVPDPNGSIAGEISTNDVATALGIVATNLAQLGLPDVGSTTPTGPEVDYLGACPPLGSIVSNANFDFSFSVTVVADAVTGESFVELEMSACFITSTDPCRVRCFDHALYWNNVPYSAVFDAFIGTPHPTAPPPGTPPDDDGSGSGGTTTSGGYSAQYVASEDDGCHCFTIVVTPWGQVMSGLEFKTHYPELVDGFLAQIAARIYPTPLDPGCVTFGES